MKKFTTKTLLALACVAVAGVQIASADTGVQIASADTGVLSGASIRTHSGGVDVVNGMTKNATLNITKDAKINWTKLNVKKDETLNFKNGTNGVLNIVESGVSKFAGNVTGESGKIIIANPNGILMQGGKFSTNGSLFLTTKDMSGVSVDDIKNIDAAYIKALEDGNGACNVVAITEGSNVTAGDINIISNGAKVDSSSLAANNAILITTDGENFATTLTRNNSNVINGSSVTMKTDDGDVKITLVGRSNGEHATNVVANGSDLKAGTTIDLESTSQGVSLQNGGTITAATTNVTGDSIVYINPAPLGTKTLTVNGDFNVKANNDRIYADSNTVVNGNAELTATRVNFHNNTINGNLTLNDPTADHSTTIDNVISCQNDVVNGNLTVKGVDDAHITNFKVSGDTNVEANRFYLHSSQLHNTTIKTNGVTVIDNVISVNRNADADGNPVVTYGKMVVDGDLKMDCGWVDLGNYDTKTQAGTFNNASTSNKPVSIGFLRDPEKNVIEVTGDLNVEAEHTVGIATQVNVGGNAALHTKQSSVLYATGDVTGELNVDGSLKVTADKSRDELLPTVGDINPEKTFAIETGLNDNLGTEVTMSDYYLYQQRDYVLSKPAPDPVNPDPVDPSPVNPKVPDDEASKILNNLLQNGVDTAMAQTFTPIAFAADEDPEVVKRIAKIVFKTPDGIVSISDRLIQKDINSSGF